MHWCLEVTAARFVSALNYIRERLCSGVGEGGREGRKEGGRVVMGREAEGGMMEEGSEIGREGGREGKRLKLGGGVSEAGIGDVEGRKNLKGRI